jgi:hypothetical protein
MNEKRLLHGVLLFLVIMGTVYALMLAGLGIMMLLGYRHVPLTVAGLFVFIGLVVAWCVNLTNTAYRRLP